MENIISKSYANLVKIVQIKHVLLVFGMHIALSVLKLLYVYTYKYVANICSLCVHLNLKWKLENFLILHLKMEYNVQCGACMIRRCN